MIPLVVLDLDGTVIGSEGIVKPCVYEAAQRYREAGGAVAVCTGRPNAGVAQKVAARLGPSTPHAFQNGAVVCYPDGDPLRVAALREAATLALVEKARELGAVLELYTPTTLYVERKTEMSEAHAKMIGVGAIVSDLQEVAQTEPVVRAQWVVTPAQRALVEALVIEGVQGSVATSPALPGAYFISVTQAGVSKASAVQQLAEAHKVDLRDVMAVGDSEGDVPMLDAVGHPVVMENAPASVRARYDTVAGSVEACGVAGALEEALRLEPVAG